MGGGGSAGGLSLWSLDSKQGHVRRCSTTLFGFCHKSRGVRLVGCFGQVKVCCTVCSSCLQHGHSAEAAAPILCLKSFSAEQKPDRICARVVRSPLCMSTSSSLMSGDLVPRTRLGCLLPIAAVTAMVCISFLVALMFGNQP